MAKYLNLDGLQTLWAKLKDTFALKKHSHTVEDIPVDSALSSTSTNPVQNKVVNTALDTKQDFGKKIVGSYDWYAFKIATVTLGAARRYISIAIQCSFADQHSSTYVVNIATPPDNSSHNPAWNSSCIDCTKIAGSDYYPSGNHWFNKILVAKTDVAGTFDVYVQCKTQNGTFIEFNAKPIGVNEGVTVLSTRIAQSAMPTENLIVASADVRKNASIVHGTAVGSSKKPIYATSQGKLTECDGTIDVSISGNAATAGTADALKNYGIPFNRTVAQGGNGKKWHRIATYENANYPTAASWDAKDAIINVYMNSYGTKGQQVHIGRLQCSLQFGHAAVTEGERPYSFKTSGSKYAKWSLWKSGYINDDAPTTQGHIDVKVVCSDTKVEWWFCNNIWDTALVYKVEYVNGPTMVSNDSGYTPEDFETYCSGKKVVNCTVGDETFIERAVRADKADNAIMTNLPQGSVNGGVTWARIAKIAGVSNDASNDAEFEFSVNPDQNYPNFCTGRCIIRSFAGTSLTGQNTYNMAFYKITARGSKPWNTSTLSNEIYGAIVPVDANDKSKGAWFYLGYRKSYAADYKILWKYWGDHVYPENPITSTQTAPVDSANILNDGGGLRMVHNGPSYATVPNAVSYSKIDRQVALFGSVTGTASNITGVAAIANGGTGASTAKAAEYAFNAAGTTQLTADPADDFRILFANTTPNSTNGVIAGYRKCSQLWNYINSKLSGASVNIGGNAATASKAATINIGAKDGNWRDILASFDGATSVYRTYLRSYADTSNGTILEIGRDKNDNTKGSQIRLIRYDASGNQLTGIIRNSTITENRNWEFPNASGTLALTSYLSSYATKVELNAKQDDISDLIPTAASASNPLCDKAYADAIGERLEARYLGCNANGDPFATHASLTSATKFYYQGAETTPDTNDITTVIADEDHKNTSNVAGTTRYRYGGVDASGKPVWAFEYVINNTGLSQAQLLAVNSGITSTKVGNYDSHLADTTKHITAAERTAWNGYATSKQDKLTEMTEQEVTDLINSLEA